MLLPFIGESVFVALTADWPATLPKPNPRGYSIAPKDQTLRTDMEVGSPKARRVTTSRYDKIQVIWEMTDVEHAIFREWYYGSTSGASGGASWFTTSLPMGTGGFSTVEARFTGPYKSEYMEGFYWAVSGELEVRDA